MSKFDFKQSVCRIPSFVQPDIPKEMFHMCMSFISRLSVKQLINTVLFNSGWKQVRLQVLNMLVIIAFDRKIFRSTHLAILFVIYLYIY